jgi:hypothetical protein
MLLNNNISNLDYYNGNGYFNFYLFWEYNKVNKDLNSIEYTQEFILNTFNINKLLKDFNNLFSVNNINEISIYTLKEYILYNDVEGLKSFDFYNYNYMLNFMIEQKYRYRFYFKDEGNDVDASKQKINNNDKKIKEDLDIYNRYKNEIELKNLKRKSAGPTFYIRKKKTKQIFKKGRILYYDEFDDVFVHEYNQLEVTDDEDDNVLQVADKEEGKAKKSQIINLVEIKLNLVTEVHRNFRQWASDLGFNNAYKECKKTFENIIVDISHPIWDSNRQYFPNTKVFNRYISHLNDEEKDAIFNVY